MPHSPAPPFSHAAPGRGGSLRWGRCPCIPRTSPTPRSTLCRSLPSLAPTAPQELPGARRAQAPIGGSLGTPHASPHRDSGTRVGRPVGGHEYCVHSQTVLAAHCLPLAGTSPHGPPGPPPGDPTLPGLALPAPRLPAGNREPKPRRWHEGCVSPCLPAGVRTLTSTEHVCTLPRALPAQLHTFACVRTLTHCARTLPHTLPACSSVCPCAHTVCVCTLTHAPSARSPMLSGLHTLTAHSHVCTLPRSTRTCGQGPHSIVHERAHRGTDACACMRTRIHVRAQARACIETNVRRSTCSLAHTRSTVLCAGSPMPPVPAVSPASPGTCPHAPCPARAPCQPSLGDIEPPCRSFPSAPSSCLGARREGTRRDTHRVRSTQVPAVAGGVSACTELLPDTAPTPRPRGRGGSPTCPAPLPEEDVGAVRHVGAVPRGMWVLVCGHGTCLQAAARVPVQGHLCPCPRPLPPCLFYR